MMPDDDLFEWDEVKRQATIAKHGIDFVAAKKIFSGPFVEFAGNSTSEDRRIAVGYADGVAVAMVFTRRGDAIRIITARKARRYERDYLRSLHERTDQPDEGRD